MPAFARTPDLYEAIPVGALPAHLSRWLSGAAGRLALGPGERWGGESGRGRRGGTSWEAVNSARQWAGQVFRQDNHSTRAGAPPVPTLSRRAASASTPGSASPCASSSARAISRLTRLSLRLIDGLQIVPHRIRDSPLVPGRLLPVSTSSNPVPSLIRADGSPVPAESPRMSFSRETIDSIRFSSRWARPARPKRPCSLLKTGQNRAHPGGPGRRREVALSVMGRRSGRRCLPRKAAECGGNLARRSAQNRRPRRSDMSRSLAGLWGRLPRDDPPLLPSGQNDGGARDPAPPPASSNDQKKPSFFGL